MRSTGIKMKTGCKGSNNLLEIDEIYISECTNPGLYKKELVHNSLRNDHYLRIYVDIYPYPELIPAISPNGEKFVKSKANNTYIDNLLRLPRI